MLPSGPRALTCSQPRRGQVDLPLCVAACPRALPGLTGTDKQLLLFTCSSCSSGLTGTYFRSFSERFSFRCVTDRVELFQDFCIKYSPCSHICEQAEALTWPCSVPVFVLTGSCIFRSKACAGASTDRGWRAPESQQCFLVAVIVFALHWCGQSR